MNIKEELKNRKSRYRIIAGFSGLIFPFIVWYALKLEQWWPIITFIVLIFVIEIHNIYLIFKERSERRFKVD